MKSPKALKSIPTFLLVVGLVLFLSSCEKDEIDKLPKKSMTGRNSFGCLINGKAFLPKKTFLKHYLQCDYDQDYNYFQISTCNSNYCFDLFLYEPRNGENVVLADTTIFGPDIVSLITDRNSVECNDDNQHLDLDNSHIYISHLDFEERIVSGTFHLEFICGGEEYIVEHGVFDLRFNIY